MGTEAVTGTAAAELTVTETGTGAAGAELAGTWKTAGVWARASPEQYAPRKAAEAARVESLRDTMIEFKSQSPLIQVRDGQISPKSQRAEKESRGDFSIAELGLIQLLPSPG
jgi:hypothetical protein